MSGRIKHARRSKYSYHNAQDFRRFNLRAYSNAVAKTNKSTIGQMIHNFLKNIYRRGEK